MLVLLDVDPPLGAIPSSSVVLTLPTRTAAAHAPPLMRRPLDSRGALRVKLLLPPRLGSRGGAARRAVLLTELAMQPPARSRAGTSRICGQRRAAPAPGGMREGGGMGEASVGVGAMRCVGHAFKCESERLISCLL